jgi:hypothetical protein
MVPASSLTAMHIACHRSTYTPPECNHRVPRLLVNKKSLLAIDGHGLCEIGRNKPLRL